MDEYHGIGGSYIVDPKTGERTLVERTEETAQQQSQPAEAPNTDAKE